MADDDRTLEACDEASLFKEELLKQKARERTRAWSAANKERKKAADKAYREANREEFKKRKREWARKKAAERRADPNRSQRVLMTAEEKRQKANARTKAYREANPERVAVTKRAWEKANHEVLNERYRERRRKRHAERQATDPSFRIRKNLTSTVRQAFRLQSLKKRNSTIELIGCSIEELKAHLETQFQPGMTWENYGYRGWHIDHRRPCASFDLTDPVQQKTCFHFTNLQPLWREDNQRKTNRLDWKPE